MVKQIVQQLAWDSAFFGYPIGKLVLAQNEQIQLPNLLNQINAYKLTYVFSESILSSDFDSKLVDKKVVFNKAVSNALKNELIGEFNESTDSYDELLNLVLLSGKYSRFNLDKNFTNNEYTSLYQQWLDNSLTAEHTKILVLKINAAIAGFITVELQDTATAHIGLIAVNNNYQGKGIGSLLIQASEYLAFVNGNKTLKVVTQYHNNAAMSLYKKNGFEIESITNIYHLWNK